MYLRALRTWSVMMILSVAAQAADPADGKPVMAPPRPNPTDDAVLRGSTTQPEVEITSNVDPVSTSCTVGNNHGGKSPIVVEVRRGGCSGTLKARITVEPGDSFSSYQTTGDYVRIFAMDPAQAKYSYSIQFSGGANSDAERLFKSSGMDNAYVSVYNNFSGTSPVSVLVQEDGAPCLTLTTPPRCWAGYDGAGDYVGLKSDASLKTYYRFCVYFTPKN